LTANAYLVEVHAALPRMLGLFDANPASRTCGVGDRQYWAWKTKDFADGSFQCVCAGLAGLAADGLLPRAIDERAILRRLDTIVRALALIRAPDGSLAEAYPRESSFCVTALGVFDVTSAIHTLGERLDARQRNQWLEIVAPMAAFLGRADETHGLIANHLATAAAALYRWSALTGVPDRRASELLGRVLAAQSDEGWYSEYGGADPGYLTLCLYYLADLHLFRPDLGLATSLEKAVAFAAHFAHPDGSFGGAYGWRGTRFLCPAAFEMLSGTVPAAASLAMFARQGVAARTIPVLTGLDDPNFAALFGAWCRAARCAAQKADLGRTDPLPCDAGAERRIEFPQAGMLVDAGASHYSIVATRKGGVVYHFGADDRTLVSGGVAARDARGNWVTSQALWRSVHAAVEGDQLTIEVELCTPRGAATAPWMFAALRVMAITIFRFRAINECFKRAAAARLMFEPRGIGVRVRRRIRLGPELVIHDEFLTRADGLELADAALSFSAIHMASQGYWQIQDDAR
jgi:hypothetical protein